MRRRIRTALVTLAAGGILLLGLNVAGAAAAPQPPAPFPVQLVTVATPTGQDKNLVSSLGLDVTEHAGPDFVEVVLHSPADADALRAAGLSWTVRIPDLAARQQRNAEIDRTYAASVAASPLPSGRNSYRLLRDYYADLDRLAAEHPEIVQPVTLPPRSLEGRPIRGVEIAADVAAEDGRPTFLMLGLHHAREWPSGELSIEFAFDLVRGFGTDERITDLLQRGRVVVVPVVNPDGFTYSRTSGEVVDLRGLDNGGTVSILATPGNAYKRKNCRIVPGQPAPPGICALAVSPGGLGAGVDPNRNYGANWGGPGAAADPIAQTYRGTAPFSEPETQAVRKFISSRQVTTLITNHTFSALVLRPPGIRPGIPGPDGEPVGSPPDEEAMKALGDAMAAQNGYLSQHSWQLYDTSGTTEDWSYNATGGYGFTFEIGPTEFHPPFRQVVDEYLGAGPLVGKGNREAFLLAAENAVDADEHSVIRGTAPAGATLRLTKEFETDSYLGQVRDRLDDTTVVGPAGSFVWHVNPSTRPEVAAYRVEVLDEQPVRSQTYRGGRTAPTQVEDREFVVTERGLAALKVDLRWPTPDDYDLEIYYREADGSLTQVGSSGNSLGAKESALIPDPRPGSYVLRVVNFAAGAPWTMTATLFDGTEKDIPGTVEAYTLSCEVDGVVRQQQPVVVDRGQQVKVDLSACAG